MIKLFNGKFTPGGSCSLLSEAASLRRRPGKPTIKLHFPGPGPVLKFTGKVIPANRKGYGLAPPSAFFSFTAMKGK
jgi:hypothetical protein